MRCMTHRGHGGSPATNCATNAAARTPSNTHALAAAAARLGRDDIDAYAVKGKYEHVNVIWQGDANARALESLTLAQCPPMILNVTGRECLSVRWLAEQFGHLLERTPVITGQEAALAWLNNASQSFARLGDVTVSLEEMMTATADWVRNGGVSLGKPTHFESHDGKF